MNVTSLSCITKLVFVSLTSTCLVKERNIWWKAIIWKQNNAIVWMWGGGMTWWPNCLVVIVCAVSCADVLAMSSSYKIIAKLYVMCYGIIYMGVKASGYHIMTGKTACLHLYRPCPNPSSQQQFLFSTVTLMSHWNSFRLVVISLL